MPTQTQIQVFTLRIYDAAYYLITIYTQLDWDKQPLRFNAGGAHPQARAVMDDFGDLVIVRGWL